MVIRIISSHTSQVVVYINVCPYSYNMYMCWRLYLKVICPFHGKMTAHHYIDMYDSTESFAERNMLSSLRDKISVTNSVFNQMSNMVIVWAQWSWPLPFWI